MYTCCRCSRTSFWRTRPRNSTLLRRRCVHNPCLSIYQSVYINLDTRSISIYLSIYLSISLIYAMICHICCRCSRTLLSKTRPRNSTLLRRRCVHICIYICLSIYQSVYINLDTRSISIYLSICLSISLRCTQCYVYLLPLLLHVALKNAPKELDVAEGAVRT